LFIRHVRRQAASRSLAESPGYGQSARQSPRTGENVVKPLSFLSRSTATTFAAAIFLALPAIAQELPDADYQHVLIKSTLMTFNDANMARDYTVMHRLSSKPFRDTFTPVQLADIFKSFADQELDIAPIVMLDPVPSVETSIVDGMLHMEGQFETRPSRVLYDLDFVSSDAGWKMIGINVNIEPVEGN